MSALSLAPTLSSLGCFAPAFARSAMGRPHHDGAIMSRPHPIYGRTRSKSSSSSSSDRESEPDPRSSSSRFERSASSSPSRGGAPAATAARFHLPTASYRPVSPTSSSSGERVPVPESEREQRMQQAYVSVQSGGYFFAGVYKPACSFVHRQQFPRRPSSNSSTRSHTAHPDYGSTGWRLSISSNPQIVLEYPGLVPARTNTVNTGKTPTKALTTLTKSWLLGAVTSFVLLSTALAFDNVRRSYD